MTSRSRLIIALHRKVPVLPPETIMRQYRRDALAILGGGTVLIVLAMLAVA